MKELLDQAQPILIALIASGGLWATVRTHLMLRDRHEDRVDETVEKLLAFQREEILRMGAHLIHAREELRRIHRESVEELATMRAEIESLKEQLSNEINRADKNWQKAKKAESENRELKKRVGELEKEVAELRVKLGQEPH